jgi:crotonobetainyl-CoA:carnitine CoA-transferase CaiB-like acyl-CoA transferase
MEIAADPQLEANGVLAEISPGLKIVQNPINVEGIEKCVPRMAPEVGQDTREVLRSARYSDEEIGAMIARGAAMTR